MTSPALATFDCPSQFASTSPSLMMIISSWRCLRGAPLLAPALRVVIWQWILSTVAVRASKASRRVPTGVGVAGSWLTLNTPEVRGSDEAGAADSATTGKQRVGRAREKRNFFMGG